MKISLRIIGLLTLLSVPALADNVLRPGTPVFDRPTLTALGIQLPVTGDDNYNSSVSVRYRKAGTTLWKNALPLFHVHPDSTLPRVIAPQFAGSILDLRPSTTYTVELHIVDLDGPIDQTLTMTGKTRSVPGDPANPHIVNVYDVNSFNAAIQNPQPGDVIILANGVYPGQLGIHNSGTEANPIVVRGASQAGVILDGQNCSSCNVLEVLGSFVHLENLTIQGGERALRFQGTGAQGNVVRRVHIRDALLAIGSRSDQLDFYIADNILEGRLGWPLAYWDDQGSQSDADGIHVEGFGHVIAHNQISGFGDAMKTSQDGARAIDFYGNEILWTYDNGVEMDEGQGNIRVMRNRFTNTFDTISAQPISGGPGYIIRNEMVNTISEPYKLHAHGNPTTEPNGVFAYHNTSLSNNTALSMQSSRTVHHFAMENNMFIGPPTNYYDLTVDWYSKIDDGVFDYNGYWPNLSFSYLTNSGIQKLYRLTGAQAAGFEVHGTIVGSDAGPTAFAGGQTAPTDYTLRYSPQDLTLAVNSPAIDRGLVLPNVNDVYNGSAPDLGARELGCPAPIYGPRLIGVDESNEPFGCQDPGTANGTYVAVLAPGPVSTVSGNVPVTTLVVPGAGLTILSVQFLVDGINVGTGAAGAANTYAGTFDSTKIANDVHVLTVMVRDSANTTTTSTGTSIYVSNSKIVAPSGTTPFATVYPRSTLRNDYGGWLGMQFTAGNNPITITALGRWYVRGNTGTHTLKLVDAKTGSDVPGSSVSVPLTAGNPNSFVYGFLAAPITLSAKGSYYLVSQEIAGTDMWWDLETVLPTNVATVDNRLYLDPSTGWSGLNPHNGTFGPVNFLYSTATLPVINITTPTTAAPITGTVTVSATASISTQGVAIASVQFKLDSTILDAGTRSGNAYTTTFDTTKFSNGAHTLTASAIDTAGNIGSGAILITIGNAVIVVTSPPKVNVTTPTANAVLTGTTVALSATATASSGLLITSVQFKLDGATVAPGSATGVGNVYATTFDTTKFSNGAHTLTAVAIDSVSNSVVSAAMPITITNIIIVPPPALPTPLLTGMGYGSPRNNYSGWVGMQLKVGTSALNVSSLGRIFLAGNSGAHIVKLANADGTDVPGAWVSLPGTPGIANEFTFVHLPTAVTLQAGGTYYLVTQEINGGDTWLDLAGIPATNVVSAVTPAYWEGNKYVTLGYPFAAFGPANLIYTLGVTTASVPAAPTVSITAPAAATSVSGSSVTLKATASAGTGLAITSVQFKLDGSVTGTGVLGAANTYSATLDSTKFSNGSHILTALATDSAGNIGTSTITFTIINGAPWMATFTNGSPRNDYTGWVGMQLTIGNAPITISSLGRFYVTGNKGTHTVKLVRASDGADMPGGSTSVPATGIPNTITYAPLASPIQLQAYTSYFLVSEEVSGGDQWGDTASLSSPPGITVNNSIYNNGLSQWIPIGASNTSFGPLSFIYSTGQPIAPSSGGVLSGTAFLTDANNATLRNDYTGWLGMRLTVGKDPLTVSALGRLYIVGNTGTHTVKLVRAIDGVDLLGGSALISVTTGIPNTITYAALPSPITLAANTSYYLVSQETKGADLWRDIASVMSTKAAAVNGSSYWDLNTAAWITMGGEQTSFAPVSFLYTEPASPSITH